MNRIAIAAADADYPAALRRHLDDRAPKRIFALGQLEILAQPSLALFCSVQCPGNLILKTYDLARELRDAGIAVISGFHSPMEKECLSILLRGPQPVIWCLAKGLTTRGALKDHAEAVAQRRLLVLSSCDGRIKRATEATAITRNEIVAALADRVFVAYAAPGGKTEAFCRKVLAWRKPLFTFDSPDTAALRSLGAHPIQNATTITSNPWPR